jgi:phosphate/sulfate permease
VFSAICVVFAHGAGEVGFMTGPLSCIYDVYMNGHLSPSLAPPIWTLLIGAFSLVIGLATYGELSALHRIGCSSRTVPTVCYIPDGDSHR